MFCDPAQNPLNLPVYSRLSRPAEAGIVLSLPLHSLRHPLDVDSKGIKPPAYRLGHRSYNVSMLVSRFFDRVVTIDLVLGEESLFDEFFVPTAHSTLDTGEEVVVVVDASWGAQPANGLFLGRVADAGTSAALLVRLDAGNGAGPAKTFRTFVDALADITDVATCCQA